VKPKAPKTPSAKIDDSMFRELILLNSDKNTGEKGTPKPQSKFSREQSLRDLELVVCVNLNLEKTSKEIHLLLKLALCREENQKWLDAITIWKKLVEVSKANNDQALHNLALNHLVVDHFRLQQFEEAKL